MSAWSAARRQAASARMQAHKPWLKATGPKTAAGKSVAKMNAYKHGSRSAATIAERRAAVHYLRVQKEFLKQVRLLLRVQRALKKSSKPTNEIMTLTIARFMKPGTKSFAMITVPRSLPYGRWADAKPGAAPPLAPERIWLMATSTASMLAMPSTLWSMF